MNTNTTNNTAQGNKNLLTKADSASPMVYIGRVAKDKLPNEKKIFVYVKDLLPFYDGELKPLSQKFQLDGGDWKGEGKVVNVVTAEWMGDDSNRRFPPDVKINEQVRVYIHVDQDVIYWTSMGRDDNVRRTERVELTAANTPNGPEDINKENAYSISMDTQDEQVIIIQTSTTGGEKNKYQIKLDAKNGSIRIADDDDNEICLESNLPRVYMKNKEGTMLEVCKKNVTIMAPEDLMIKAGRQLLIDSPLVSVDSLKGAGIINMKSKAVSMTSNGMVMTAPVIGLNGATEAKSVVTPSIVSALYRSSGLPSLTRSTRSSVTSRSISLPSVPGLPNIPTLPSLPSMDAILNLPGFTTYQGATINTALGTGKIFNNIPNLDGGYMSKRHAIAWEDTVKALQNICLDLIRIDGKIGYGNSTGTIMSSIYEAIVPNSLGL